MSRARRIISVQCLPPQVTKPNWWFCIIWFSFLHKMQARGMYSWTYFTLQMCSSYHSRSKHLKLPGDVSQSPPIVSEAVSLVRCPSCSECTDRRAWLECITWQLCSAYFSTRLLIWAEGREDDLFNMEINFYRVFTRKLRDLEGNKGSLKEIKACFAWTGQWTSILLNKIL